MVNSDLASFAFTVRALRARTVKVVFGGAKRRRKPLFEDNSARSQLTIKNIFNCKNHQKSFCARCAQNDF
jgi:hypothetical protein